MERTRGAATRGTRGIAVARISQRLVHGSQLIESGGRVIFQRISLDYCLLHSFIHSRPMPLSIGLVGEIFVGSSILLSLNIHQTSGFIAELQKVR